MVGTVEIECTHGADGAEMDMDPRPVDELQVEDLRHEQFGHGRYQWHAAVDDARIEKERGEVGGRALRLVAAAAAGRGGGATRIVRAGAAAAAGVGLDEEGGGRAGGGWAEGGEDGSGGRGRGPEGGGRAVQRREGALGGARCCEDGGIGARGVGGGRADGGDK